MIRWALVNGAKSQPVEGVTGTCPTCGRELVPAGLAWKHTSGPASCWQARWIERFPAEMCHRVVGGLTADVLLPGGRALELMPIGTGGNPWSREKARNGRVVWVFETGDAVEEERLTLVRTGPRDRSYVWHKPRTTVRRCGCPVYLDLGRGWLLAVRTLQRDETAPAGQPRAFRGDGSLVSVDEFVAHALAGFR